MPIEELVKLLDNRMFTPFRIHITDGSHHDIHHPQQCFLMPRSVLVGTPSSLLPPFVMADYVNIALLHITKLEPLQTPSSPSGNGSPNQ